MPFTSEDNRSKRYTGNGATTAFSWPNQLRASGDLNVYLYTVADGVEVAQTEVTHYTIALAADKSSATVNFGTAPTTAYEVVLEYGTALTNAVDHQNYDGTPAEIMNETDDRSATRDLTLKRELDRTIKAQASQDFDGTIPNMFGKDAYAIVVNDDGDGTFSLALENVASGTVSGPDPAASTDNAVVRWDGTTGRLLQDSGVTINDSDSMTGVNQLLTTGLITAGNALTVTTGSLTVSEGNILADKATSCTLSLSSDGKGFEVVCRATGVQTVRSSDVGGSLELRGDDGVDNLTLAGAAGSQTAVFVGEVTSNDTSSPSATGGGLFRSSSNDGATAISDTDRLGRFVFSGYDGSNEQTTASLSAIATENWAAGSAEGTKVVIATTPNGATSANSVLTCEEDGSVTAAGALTAIGLITGAALEIGGNLTAGSMLDVHNEDDMVSDSDRALATQQSIKKYVDDQILGNDTLQDIYDNGSAGADILTDATRLGLTIQRGSGADTDVVIEGQNGAGTTTFSVTGAGVTTSAGLLTASAGLTVTTGQLTVSEGDILADKATSCRVSLTSGAKNLEMSCLASGVHDIASQALGDTLVLKADNDITNLTLSGAAGSELATFAGDVDVVGDLSTTGFFNIGPAIDVTIATGSVAATGTNLRIDTEASAATDDVDNITGGTTGDIIIISQANSSRDITIKHNAPGNIRLPTGDAVFLNVNSRITLYFDGTNWIELSRSL